MRGARDATQPAGQVAPGRGSPLLRHLIVLYPAAWRRRYGDEFAALLEQTPLTLRALFDVAVSAVDAHVNPTGPMRRWPFMFERLRASELVVFAGWVLFVVAGLGFSKMSEDLVTASPPIAAGPVVFVAYSTVLVGAVVALVAVLIAGVPIALAIARTSSRAHRGRQLGLLAVPPVSLVVWIGFTFLLVDVVVPGPGLDGPARVIVFLAWAGVFCLAAVASTVAVTVAAINGDVAPELYRRAVKPALIVAGAMGVVLIAVGVWGLALLATEPSFFWGGHGVLATSTALSWLGVIAGMAGGTALAIRGAALARVNRLV